MEAIIPMNRLDAIEEELISTFEEIARALPSGRATLVVKRAPQIEHCGVSVWLTPAEPQAAEIVADAVNGNSTISLSLGRHTPVELETKGNSKVIRELKEICQAIIDGKFSEDLWLVGTEVTKSVGTIEIGGRRQVFRYFGRFFPLRTKVREHVHYLPYGSG